MKYDLNALLFGVNSVAIPDVTLGSLLKQAITTDTQETKPEQKMERYRLYVKLADANADTDFTVEEAAALKQASLTVFTTLVAGQICTLLEKGA